MHVSLSIMTFYVNILYVPIKEEIMSMLDERDHAIDNEPIEEVDNVQVGDVVVDRAGSKDVESALL